MLKKHLLILVLIVSLQNSSGFLATLTAIINGVSMVVDFIKTLPSAVHSVKELIGSFGSNKPKTLDDGTQNSAAPNSVIPNSASIANTMEKYHDEFVQKFREIDNKMDNLKLFVSDRFTHIEDLIRLLPQQIDFMLKRQIIGEFIMTVNQKWDRIMRFLEGEVNVAGYSFEMQSILLHIEPNLMKFRVSTIPLTELASTAFGILTDIAEMQEAKGLTLCNGETSHHSVINIFQIIVSTEIKAFTLQALAFNEANRENDAWKGMMNQSQIELEQQLAKYINDLKNALTIERRTYIKACHSKDTEYHASVYYGIGIQVQEAIPRNCSLIETKSKCESFIHCANSYDYSRMFPALCQHSSSEEPVALKSSLCMCQYYNRFILAMMQSRVNENYVVVAMRFQKHENYIYIQIAEGKLEANGYISDYSWMEPTRKNNGDDPFEATLSIMEGQIMALGDTQLPAGYILSGIKLSPETIFEEKGFKIGLYGVGFNYETGKLNPTDETFVRASDPSRYQSQYSDTKEQQDSSEHTVVEFRIKNYNPYNLSTLPPKLNGAAILPDPLSPLGGVGLFHEISPNNVPCVSLRLFTIDYLHFMSSFEIFNFRASTSLDVCKIA